MTNWKGFGRKGCGILQVAYWHFYGRIEENLEGPQDNWHPVQD